MAAARLILRHHFALGDTVLLTALARDVALAYPGRFEVLVDCHFREVFDHHPHARLASAADLRADSGAKVADISYRDGIRAAGRGQKVHMLAWYHLHLSQRLGLAVTPRLPRGCLVLAGAERDALAAGRYWVVVAGGKTDCTTKVWRPGRWQAVVDGLASRGIACVQAGGRFSNNYHPRLSGVTDMVGRTPSARDLFRLIARADGVICCVTAAMHIAACFDKPCVVIAGGREEPWWEGYTNQYGAFGPDCAPVAVEHRFLHTLGLLDCCKDRGCWRHRVLPLNNHDRWDTPERRCKLPVMSGTEAAPQCLDLITPEHVVAAVMSYYDKGVLLPPSNPVSIAVTGPGPVQYPGPRTVIPDPAPAPAPIPKTLLSSGPATPVNIDHPTVGGKYTLFVLCYGPHAELAKRCLRSVFETVPARCLDVRVGCNAVEPATTAFLRTLPITRVYDRPGNDKKYPLMRAMFNDPDCPIRTPYVIWLDDDTRIADPAWLNVLTDTIVANDPQGAKLYGNILVHDTQMYAKGGRDPLQWFRDASWWRGRPLRVRGRESEAPNGTAIRFVAGWAWSASVAALRQADVPDRRLVHNGGDCCIGEQFHQAGFKLKQFNEGKKYVWTPTKENGGRRGFREVFPWSIPLENI